MVHIKFADIIEAINESGGRAEAYTGRAMYGKRCLGVVCDDPSNLVFDIISNFVIAASGDKSEIVDQIVELCSSLRGFRVDNMGHMKIVYWPGIEWEASDSFDDEDTEEEAASLP